MTFRRYVREYVRHRGFPPRPQYAYIGYRDLYVHQRITAFLLAAVPGWIAALGVYFGILIVLGGPPTAVDVAIAFAASIVFGTVAIFAFGLPLSDWRFNIPLHGVWP